MSAAGTSREEPLLKSADMFKTVHSWSRDGRFIVFAQLEPDTRRDLWILPLDGDRKPRLYLRTRADEMDGEISPDGRWMAYRSDETGRYEIYVQSFPTPGEKYAITTNGASGGQWAPDGRRFFYGKDREGFGVDVSPGPPFHVGSPRLIGVVPKDAVAAAPAPDFRRALVSLPAGGTTAASLTVITDWAAAIRKN